MDLIWMAGKGTQHFCGLAYTSQLSRNDVHVCCFNAYYALLYSFQILCSFWLFSTYICLVCA